MDTALRRLRTEAQQLTRGNGTAAFRTSAVALARPRLATGVSFVRVARELGLPTKNLARWLQHHRAPVLRPVAVRPDPTPPAPPAVGVMFVTPHGFRVEGLVRDGLVAELRALS